MASPVFTYGGRYEEQSGIHMDYVFQTAANLAAYHLFLEQQTPLERELIRFTQTDHQMPFQPDFEIGTWENLPDVQTEAARLTGVALRKEESATCQPKDYQKSRLYKTVDCNNFALTGECRYGVKCQFAHGEEELRPKRPRNTLYKTKLCRNITKTRQCPFGSRCDYIHPDEVVKMGAVVEPVSEKEPEVGHGLRRLATGPNWTDEGKTGAAVESVTKKEPEMGHGLAHLATGPNYWTDEGKMGAVVQPLTEKKPEVGRGLGHDYYLYNLEKRIAQTCGGLWLSDSSSISTGYRSFADDLFDMMTAQQFGSYSLSDGGSNYSTGSPSLSGDESELGSVGDSDSEGNPDEPCPSPYSIQTNNGCFSSVDPESRETNHWEYNLEKRVLEYLGL